MTWAGGAAAVSKSDWTPLRGRRVVVWPDRDDPGRRAAEEIRRILPHAEVLDVGGDDGSDVADLLEHEGAEAVRRFVAECPRAPAAAAEAARDASDWTADVPPQDGTADAPGRTATAAWPDPIDLSALGASEPVPPRHIVPAWLPEGEVTLFAGHGGAGKSSIALQLAACIALGRQWCGIEASQRRVVYISCEDGRDVLHWRLERIARHLGVALAKLAEHLQVIDASGIDPEMMIDPGRGDPPILTTHYTELAQRIATDSVVVLDGASDLYGASEIMRRHVRCFVRALRRLAGEHGAVLLLAHVDKAAARNRDSGDRYSGSTAWHNSVRARWELQTDGDGLALALAKANHAQAGAEIRLRWNPEAHMHLPLKAPDDGGIVGSIRERQQRDALVAAIRACTEPIPAAMTGQRTAWHVLDARPELPAIYRNGREGRRRFWADIERLRAMRVIRTASIRRNDRHYREVIELATEERGECGQS